MKKTIILASASKRRSQILNSCGIRHSVAVSGAAEVVRAGYGISRLVVKNARAKAGRIAARYKNAVVIGADTLVAVGGNVIGKPRSKEDARQLLRLFSGKRIAVFTGLFVMDTASGKTAGGYEKSYVYVKKINSRSINRYFNALRPYDKAGGFSIEGAGSILFDDIRGSYFNVLGLPMGRLAELFKDIGLDILDFMGK